MQVTQYYFPFKSAHEMIKLVHRCEEYNGSKSVILNFKENSFNANTSATLYLNGSMKNKGVLYTYQGYIVNNDLNDNMDIERQLNSFYGKSNILMATRILKDFGERLQIFITPLLTLV